MKDDFLYFVDFGLEHISLLACKIKDNRLIDILFVKECKIKPTKQRTQNIFNQTENFEILLKVISDCEKELKTYIYEVILVLKTQYINVMNLSEVLNFNKKQKISKKHIEMLSHKMIKYYYNSDNILLDFVKNKSILDETIEVSNPNKMVCKKFLFNATLVGIKQVFIDQISSYMERYKIHIKHYISPCVCVFSLLKESIPNKGNILLIDIGSSATEYCLIRNGSIYFLKNINLGGIDMTRDISEEMRIFIGNADELKNKLSSYSHNESEKEDIVKRSEQVADARLIEIINYIKKSFSKNNKYLNFKKIFVFGGTSNYKNTAKIITDIFDTDVEIINDKIVLNSEILHNKIKENFMNKENIQLFGAVDFYMKNIYLYKNAKKGFLFESFSKIACFLKDILY